MSPKLYYVQCKGRDDEPRMDAYVISNNAEFAYLYLREYLDLHNIGTPEQRSLRTLNLMAEYPNGKDNLVECGMMLLGYGVKEE